MYVDHSGSSGERGARGGMITSSSDESDTVIAILFLFRMMGLKFDLLLSGYG
jgi:hypothetical protein